MACIQIYLVGFLSAGNKLMSAWYTSHVFAAHRPTASPDSIPSQTIGGPVTAAASSLKPPPTDQNSHSDEVPRPLMPHGTFINLQMKPRVISMTDSPPSQGVPTAISWVSAKLELLRHQLRTWSWAREGGSNPAVPSIDADECRRLDAELTGLRCFEAADPETRERCRRLAAQCYTAQPDPEDVQRKFPAPGPPCTSAIAIDVGPSQAVAWKCTLKQAPKFFWESRLSSHLDARWGTFSLSPEQRRGALADTFRAWAAFTEERKLQSWLFAGSLIGWFFNKDMLPWDDDLDVQVLASHLLSPKHYLPHNHTTYRNRFYFEINPNSQYRSVDWNNVIDARFVDTATGVFIDVVAVSYDPAWRTLTCKRHERFNPAVLFPLWRTTFMGAPAWVPHDPGQALVAKYGPNVVLHQQPQPHPTTRCVPGPCRLHPFDPETLRWGNPETSLPPAVGEFHSFGVMADLLSR
eukprot:EG_transcript_7946